MSPFREPDASRPVIMTIAGKVLGLNSQTGELQWDYALGGGGYPTALLVTENRIYACCPPRVACLEYPTGAEVWTSTVSSGATGTLLLEAGHLYVATCGELDCFNSEGQRLWHNALKGKGAGPTALGLPGNVMQGEFWT
jgi:outer membrane protein assembly factor BamB